MNIDLKHPLAVDIRQQITKASVDFGLIEANDKIMVCVSGGKDSSILLASLLEIQRKAPFHFTFEAAILDQKQPGFWLEPFQQWVESLGIKLHIIEKDTYSIVKEKITTGTYCSLCSRLRRAILYDYAEAQGFTKLALGHHRDDLIETALLNLFYSGHVASMPPKLRSDDGKHILIRPLCYVPESQLIELSQIWNFPIIPCNLCGSQDGMKRKKIKKLLLDLEKEIPGVKSSLLTSLSQVQLSQLMDQRHWDFKGLSAVTSTATSTATSEPVLDHRPASEHTSDVLN